MRAWLPLAVAFAALTWRATLIAVAAVAGDRVAGELQPPRLGLALAAIAVAAGARTSCGTARHGDQWPDDSHHKPFGEMQVSTERNLVTAVAALFNQRAGCTRG
jgi:hypothetical protein